MVTGDAGGVAGALWAVAAGFAAVAQDIGVIGAFVVDFGSVQVVPAVPHRNRALSLDKATVLRKSRRNRAYRFFCFITIV
jgi:hypothetical protein